MRTNNRKRWIWLASAILLAGLMVVAGMASIGAASALRPAPVAAEAGATDSMLAPAAPPNAQVAHLAPFAMTPDTVVTITVDGTAVLTDVAFADSTAYLELMTGTQLIEVFPAGSMSPAITGTVDLAEDGEYTLIAIGGANMWDLELLALTDDTTPPAAGNAKVRIGHLAPFAAGTVTTTADVVVNDAVFLDDVTYRDIEPYVELPAGTYDIEITSPDGSVVYIDPLPVTLNDGDILSLFAVGDGRNQPLGVFALPSGSPGFLLPLAPRVQVAHLAPFAMDPGTSVTVTLDGMPVLTDFEFAQSTGYLWVPTGTHEIQVFATGSMTPVITGSVVFEADMNYTAIATGGANNAPLALRVLEDETVRMSGVAMLRIGHLAPFSDTSTLADVRLQDGTVLPGFDDIPFGTIADYITLPPGVYDLKITSPDGSVTLIDPGPVELLEGDIYSAFAVGDGTNQPLGIFALPSGEEGFLLPLAAQFQVAHLAPFAMDPGTAVTVTIDGMPALPDVEFGDSTGYMPIEVGTYEFGIVPAGSMVPVLTETFTFSHATSYALLAVGGANGWDLELLQLEDDLTPPASGSAKVRIGHLAPFASEVISTTADVRLADGTAVLENVTYGAIAPYTELPEGVYDLQITTPGGTTVLIDPTFPVPVNDGDILSIFAVGDGVNQPLDLFILPAGQPGYLRSAVATTLYLPLIYQMYEP